MTQAIVYCRVSDMKQIKDGHGLDGQEQACRSYALKNNLDVVKVFREEGITGASRDRPAFFDMLVFIEKEKTPFKIIIDDMARLARDHIVYAHLKRQLKQLGCDLDFVNMTFEQTPEGEYVETILAATAELERKQNARRTKSRMIERMKAGFYVFNPPFGFKFVKDAVLGKILVKDEPMATYVTEALEGFASGRFKTQMEVKCFLESRTDQRIHATSIRRLLERRLYIGVLESKKHDIYAKGQHEPLISVETYNKIQHRLATETRGSYETPKKHLYPLRGFVCCSVCDNPLTASKSRGKGGQYAYYACCNIKCVEKGRTTSQKQLEGDFLQLLKESALHKELLSRVERICFDAFQQQESRSKQKLKIRQQKKRAIDAEIRELTNSFMNTKTDVLRQRIEERIQGLQVQKTGFDVEQPNDDLKLDFRTVFDGVREILEKPDKLWSVGGYEEKQLIQRVVFEHPPKYERRIGFRTAEKSLPYELLGGGSKGDSPMVHQKLVFSNTTNLLGAFFRMWEMIQKSPN